MTPEQKALVQATWKLVVPIADKAATLFYDRLFFLDPSLTKLFPADLTQQKRKLVQSLAMVIGSLGQVEDIVPSLQALGRRHAGYGVRDGHYATVGSALLWTLEQGLGSAWTTETKEAWASAYGLVAGTMQAAAAEMPQAA